MADDGIRLLFLADTQLGCMASFSGVNESDLERFDRQGMRVKIFDPTDSLEWDLARFRGCVAEINRLQPDLVVIGGDMIDETSRSDQLEAYREIADTSEIPIHVAPGNHDICHDANIPTEDSIEWYRTEFGPEHEAITRELPDGSTLTVLTVNSPVIDQPRKVEGGFEAEMSWIEGQLQAKAPGPTIVVSHHPPFVRDPDEGHNYWNIPIERRRPFLDLLADHDVDLLLCGHRHLNDAAEYRGIEIVTSSAAGFPLGTAPPGYRLVDVSGTHISHAYYGVPEPGWEAIGGPPEPDAQTAG